MHGYRVDNIRYKQVIISAYQAMKGKYSQVQGQIFGWGANMAQLQMGRAGCSGVLEVSRSAEMSLDCGLKSFLVPGSIALVFHILGRTTKLQRRSSDNCFVSTSNTNRILNLGSGSNTIHNPNLKPHWNPQPNPKPNPKPNRIDLLSPVNIYLCWSTWWQETVPDYKIVSNVITPLVWSWSY